MTKITLLSLVAASVILTGCDDKAKEAAVDATSAVTEAVKTTGTEVAEVAKEKVVEVVKETAAKATDAAAALKERAAATTEAAKETVAADAGSAEGKAAYAKCVSCHGANGSTKALGKSAVLAGQSAADLETALHGYKAGTRNVAGMGMLMKGQVASMDDAAIKAVAAYIATFK